VTLPLTRARSHRGVEELSSGWRVFVGWKGADVPPAKLRRYVVTFERLHVYRALTHEWSLHLYAGEQGAGSVLEGSGLNPNNEPFANVSRGENINLNHRFTVELLPGQPLRVAARAESWTLLGGSDFLGTAERILGDAGDQTFDLPATGHVAVGYENDIDKMCVPEVCYSVRVKVQRVGG
jgi:hypothetical protein